MMNMIGAAEFKARCLRVINQMNKDGKPVTITKRGLPRSIPASGRSFRLVRHGMIVLDTHTSIPLHPITRPPSQVSDGHDNDLIWPEAVDYLIWECGDQDSTRVAVLRDYRADFGMGANAGKGCVSRVQEFTAEPGSLGFVPSDRFPEFFGGRCTGKNLHRPRISLSIRRLTASQGSSSTVPPSMASTRRSISVAHAASASGSAGPSRLFRSSAASSARASISRRRASTRTD